ncbi:MAG: hypothetical protein SGPRY_014960, partial [Prymnesium sp.]
RALANSWATMLPPQEAYMADVQRRNSHADSRKTRRYQPSLQRLMVAAKQGDDLELSDLLKRCPDNVTATELDSRTALHVACFANQAACAKLLLDAGAIIDRECADLESDCLLLLETCAHLLPARFACCRAYARRHHSSDSCCPKREP